MIVLGFMIVAISLLTAICKLRSGPTAAPPKRRMSILFLAANPGGTSKLALDEECAAIQRELRLTRYGDDFEFVSRWAVTVDDMARHLMELQPTIIHFSGHARGNEFLHPGAHGTIRDASSATDPGTNGILLQGEQGGSQLVCARALAMMIRSATTSARVLVLNACYSHAQAEELRRSVDCVVGMGGAITDDAALSFAVSFYRALGNRRSVGAAVKHAIATLAAKQVPDACRPRLRARDGLDAHQVVLSARRPVRHERLVRPATSIAGLSLAGNDAPADSQPWFTPIP